MEITNYEVKQLSNVASRKFKAVTSKIYHPSVNKFHTEKQNYPALHPTHMVSAPYGLDHLQVCSNHTIRFWLAAATGLSKLCVWFDQVLSSKLASF